MEDLIEEAAIISEKMAAREKVKMRSKLLRRILRQIRAMHDETGAEMASKIGISPSMLSSIENGTRFPPQPFPSMVIEAYKLRGRERDSLLVACAMATDMPLEIDLEDKCYDEAYMRVAYFLANRLTEADIEVLQEVCITIEKSIEKKRENLEASPISQMAELPIFLPDGWSADKESTDDKD